MNPNPVPSTPCRIAANFGLFDILAPINVGSHLSSPGFLRAKIIRKDQSTRMPELPYRTL